MSPTIPFDIASELRLVPGLEGLGEEAFREIVAAATQRHVPASFPLVEQGVVSTGIVALVRGAAKTVRTALVEGAAPVVLDVMRAPAFVAELSVLDGCPAAASVITLRSSHFISIEAAALKSLMRRSVAISDFFVQQSAQLSRALVRRIDELVTGSVDERVKHLLKSLARAHGTPHGQGRFIALPLRRRDIACMVNATTETVSRLLAKFEREGIVRSTRDGIWVRTFPPPTATLDLERRVALPQGDAQKAK